MANNPKSFWLALSTFIFVLLSLVYTYVILAVPAPRLPSIATQRAITAVENERWIFVGDVHGMYDELQELLSLVDAEKPDTHVVLLGDFVSKGPQSGKVVHYLEENRNSTHCILGNHEINVMFAYLNRRDLKKRLSRKNSRWDPVVFDTENYVPRHDQVNNKHKLLAQQLGISKLTSMATLCSAELQIHLNASDHTLIAVHAGLAPDFEGKQPKIGDITTMKYMLPKDHSKTSKYKFYKARRWFKLWNADTAPENVTVLYGHDANSGLNLRKQTKGLDSGCVGGGKLTALEYVYKNGKYHEYLHQVKCRQFM
ncbi:LAME_0F15786g1_1 [Lachancea meyersii CBS 8951]|uniref:LAME_0F15786g1_1 n=1 Tax=Lachancea meyersii CBS 8951 TaxID=1266667 RepID=A0A1G4JYP4_9SACH|nr:LAME_0F15786g1_1 [Lachancea meyersii CBS 8951]